MESIFESDRFVVIDEVLTEAEFNAVSAWVEAESYEFGNMPEWYKEYRLSDGFSLEGQNGFVSRPLVSSNEVPSFPTGTVLDPLIEHIQGIAEICEGVLGTQGTDWDFFTCNAFLYPMHTSRGFHADVDQANPRSGAFTFYTHRYWNVEWGGEIMITDGRETDYEPGSTFGNARENASLMRYGMGHYVYPKPNRLVLVRSGAVHQIREVTAAAGNNVRCSLTGFFIKLPPGYGVDSADAVVG